MEKEITKYVYPYAWLDEAVEVTLNPQRSNVIELKAHQLEAIKSRFYQELQEILKDLKGCTFLLASFDEMQTIVNRYYSALILLEQQAMANLAGYPDEHPIATFGEEIMEYIRDIDKYFKNRYAKYVSETNTKLNKSSNQSTGFLKVLCNLTGDQIGIILKAADDTRLIAAKSLRLIFQSIVPHLSTHVAANLSWDSLRKSTYRMEQADKDIVIAVLEKLIRKIREY